ncbi:MULTISPECIES: LiaF transmembrane domain-containing protein [Oceanobacillus]|uniref:LiaF transmembrane domain-containing protein n=1 Tax=Oceanobacillus TaxID=182709 RepID=UPI002F96233F
MKRKHSLLAYLCIGIGIFLLLRELRIPFFVDLYSWQSFLIVIGIGIIIHSYTTKTYQNLFIGTLLFGIGIHLHGVKHYSFWIDDWSVYFIIIGLAFIIRYTKTKKGFFLGLFSILLGLLFLFSEQLSIYTSWLEPIVSLLERFWPILLILLGMFMLKRK